MNDISARVKYGIQKDSLASQLLHLLRGVAAVVVLINHSRSLFMVEYGNVVEINHFVDLIYFITGFGHQAVVVFFVLSGYFIGTSVLNSSKNWSWKLYLTNRLTRLYVVLIPALIIGSILDAIGIYGLQMTSLYSGAMGESILFYSAIERLNVGTFLGNLFFLQEIIVKPLGSNGPLWSLSYEFWFYIMFPLMICILKEKRIFLKFTYLFLLVLLAFFVGKTILIYFFVWLLGVLVLIINRIGILKALKNWQQRVLLSCSGIALIVLLSVVRLGKIDNYLFADYLLAFIFSCFLLFLIETFSNKEKKLGRIGLLLGDISYTLYVVHVPFLVFVYGIFLKADFSKLQPSNIGILVWTIFNVAAILYAWQFAKLTEFKTEIFKKKISAVLIAK